MELRTHGKTDSELRSSLGSWFGNGEKKGPFALLTKNAHVGICSDDSHANLKHRVVGFFVVIFKILFGWV